MSLRYHFPFTFPPLPSSLLPFPLQAAYLVGISDPTSRAAEPGLVDQTRFVAAKEAIASAVQTIADPHARGEEASGSGCVNYVTKDISVCVCLP